MTKARSNAVANAAKGDLTVGNGTNLSGILAVGSNGDTLVADSSTSTGLRYTENYAAGKNKIINGDFSINQRNFTTRTDDTHGFDRWQMAPSGATATYSAQTFTPGAAPVAGYEAINFARIAVTTGNDNCRIQQKIEDVRTFAGETVTVSFWAKGTNPSTAGNLTVLFQQEFGTGGSPSASVTTAPQTFVLTANWTRYSLTFAIPSISGKTIGTTANTSSLGLWIGQGSSTSTDAWTLDLWGVQVEAGSVATAFQTATGTIQGELAACQRYFYLTSSADGAYTQYGMGQAVSTSAAKFPSPFPVTMRIAPTSVVVTGNIGLLNAGDSAINNGTITVNVPSNNRASLQVAGSSGVVAGNATTIMSNNSTATSLAFSAEL